MPKFPNNFDVLELYLNPNPESPNYKVATEEVGSQMRLYVKRLKDGITKILDLSIAGQGPAGPVFALTGERQNGEPILLNPIFQHKMDIREGEKTFDQSIVGSAEYLARAIGAGYDILDKEQSKDINKAFNRVLTKGAWNLPAPLRSPWNTTEATRSEMINRIHYQSSVLDIRQDDKTGRWINYQRAPKTYEVPAFREAYKENLLGATGLIPGMPGIGWKNIRENSLWFEEKGRFLESYGKSVTNYNPPSVLGGPESVSGTSIFLNRTPAKVVKGMSVETGGKSTFPLEWVKTPTGRLLERIEPGVTSETKRDYYTSSNVLHQGEGTTRDNYTRENYVVMNNIFPGGGYTYEREGAKRPYSYGVPAPRTETLPIKDLRDLISGKTRIQMNNIIGKEFDAKPGGISAGFLVQGDETTPIRLKGSGSSTYSPTGYGMQIPRYWNPTTGEASNVLEKDYEETTGVAKQIAEQQGMRVGRGGKSSTLLEITGWNLGASKIRDENKLGLDPLGIKASLEYEGLSLPATVATADIKSPGFIRNLFFGEKSFSQISSILHDYAKSTGGNAPEEKLARYFDKAYSSRSGQGNLNIDWERAAEFYGKQSGGNFAGNGGELTSAIFNKLIMEPEGGSTRNRRNLELYGAGKTPGAIVPLGPIQTETWKLQQQSVALALRDLEPGISDKEIRQRIKEKMFVKDGMKYGVMGKNDLYIRALAGRVAEYPGGYGLNPEAQLAISQEYPIFAKESGLDVSTRGKRGRIGQAVERMFEFVSWQKSAAEGSKDLPTSGYIDIDDTKAQQLASFLGQAKASGLGESEYTSGLKEILGDSMDMYRFPRSNTFMPSIEAAERLQYKKHGEDVGGMFRAYSKSLEKVSKLELNLKDRPPEQGEGHQAVSSFYNMIKGVVEAGGEAYKKVFSRGPRAGIGGTYVTMEALGPGEMWMPPDERKRMLRGMGFRGKSLINAMEKLGREGYSGLFMRYPQGSRRNSLTPIRNVSDTEMAQRVGGEAFTNILSSNEINSTTFVSPDVAELEAGDSDRDWFAASFALKKQGGKVEIQEGATNEIEQARMNTASAVRERLGTVFQDPNASKMFSSMYQSALDMFSNKNIMGGLTKGQKSYPIEELLDAVDLRNAAKSKNTPQAYNMGRIQMGTALQLGLKAGVITTQLSARQLFYSLGTDSKNTGQNTAGGAYPSMIVNSRFELGFDKQGNRTLPILTSRAHRGKGGKLRLDLGQLTSNSGPQNFLTQVASLASQPFTVDGKVINPLSPEQFVASFAINGEDTGLLEKIKNARPENWGGIYGQYLTDQIPEEMRYQPGDDAATNVEKENRRAQVRKQFAERVPYIANMFTQAAVRTMNLSQADRETDEYSKMQLASQAAWEEGTGVNWNKAAAMASIHLKKVPGAKSLTQLLAYNAQVAMGDKTVEQTLAKQYGRRFNIPIGEIADAQVAMDIARGPTTRQAEIENQLMSIAGQPRTPEATAKADALRAEYTAIHPITDPSSVSETIDDPAGIAAEKRDMARTKTKRLQEKQERIANGTATASDFETFKEFAAYGGGGSWRGGGGGGGGGSRGGGYSSRSPNMGSTNEDIQAAYVYAKDQESSIVQAYESMGEILETMGYSQKGKMEQGGDIFTGIGKVLASPKRSEFLQRVAPLLPTARRARKVRMGAAGSMIRWDSSGMTDREVRGYLESISAGGEGYGEATKALGFMYKATGTSENINAPMLAEANALGKDIMLQVLAQDMRRLGMSGDSMAAMGGGREQGMQDFIAQNPSAKKLFRQAMRLSKVAGPSNQDNLPSDLVQIAQLGKTAEALTPGIFKEGKEQDTISATPEKRQKLIDLINETAVAEEKLIKARSKGIGSIRDEEEALRDVQSRKKDFIKSIFEDNLRQTVKEGEQAYLSGSMPGKQARAWESAQSKLSFIDQQQMLEKEESGWGGTARRLFGGFGLMYMRSIAGIITSGIGQGQQEAMGLGQTIAQQSAATFGIRQQVYNPQMALLNKQALMGSNANPLLGAQTWVANYPVIGDVGGMAAAGVGAWGATQWAAGTFPAGSTAAKFLGKAALPIAIGATLITGGSEISQKIQDQESLAYRLSKFSPLWQQVAAPTDTLAQIMSGGFQYKPFAATPTFKEGSVGAKSKEREEWYAQARQQLTNSATFGQLQKLGGSGGFAGTVSGTTRLLMERPGMDIYSQQGMASAASLYARNPNWQITDALTRQLAGGADQQIPDQQLAQTMLLGTGRGTAYGWQRNEGGNLRVDELTKQLSGMNLSQEQRVAITTGAEFAASMSGFRYMAGAPSTSVHRADPEEFGKLLLGFQEKLSKFVGTAAEDAIRASQEAYMANTAIGRVTQPVNPDDFSVNMTPEEADKIIAKANASAYSANQLRGMAQTQFNQSAFYSNAELGEKIYGQMTGMSGGMASFYSRALNADPMALATLAQGGMNLGGLPGAQTIQGRTINANFLAMTDVNNGRLTGLPYGTTGLQMGSLSSQQMGQNIFGTTQNRSVNAAVNGVQLEQPITLGSGVQLTTIGGQQGMAYDWMQQSYGFQMQGLDLQQQNMILGWAHTQAQWRIQNKQIALSNWYQTQQFGLQQEQINQSKENIGIGNAIQQQQMTLTRSWAKEDWGYQDQTRNMQWGWKQEDFAEESRFMTGRQRKLAERQMGRETTLHNLETDQIDKTRARQEELWKLEDRRFDLQKKQQQESLDMQQKQLDLQKKYFEEQKKLQAQQIAEERKYQKEQQKIQQQQLDLQKKQAKATHEHEEAVFAMSLAIQSMSGELNTLSGDGMERLREGLAGVLDQINKIYDAGMNPPSTDPTNSSNNNIPVPQQAQNFPYGQDQTEPIQYQANDTSYFFRSGKTEKQQNISIYIGNEHLSRFVLDAVTKELRT